jgi:phage terminase large subunit GpA-like protein
VAVFKSETYRLLRLDRPTDEDLETGTAFPDGYVHLPRGIDSEWLKQFCAEQLVTVRNRQGFSKLEWQKLRERNEALDCRVYARAAAWIAGIDRWSERTWANLEGQAGMAEVHAPGRPSNDGPQAGRPTPRRETGWLAGRQRNWLR